MKIPFKYYLHDDYESGELAHYILNQLQAQGAELGVDADEFSEKIGSPFYEVTLECEFDTETHEVTVVKTSL